ncbi:MAG: hypothetical protein ABIV06_03675 [Thermoanaerobaculia bacterium]
MLGVLSRSVSHGVLALRRALTWNSPYTHGIETKVTIEFRVVAGAKGTEVVLTHELLPVKEVEGHRRGWTEAIASCGRFFAAQPGTVAGTQAARSTGAAAATH